MTLKHMTDTAVAHTYLGFCEDKGYIYSVQTSLTSYKVVAVKNNEVTVLISYESNVVEGSL